MISIHNRRSFMARSAVILAALVIMPCATRAHDAPSQVGTHAPFEIEDNVATDTSTASYDDTVKWLTEYLLKNGSCRYTKVVSIGGVRVPVKTNETVLAATVKADALELRVRTEYTFDGPGRTELSETLSLPLRFVKRISTTDGDPGWKPAAGKHGQFSYVTITISCGHNEIEDHAATRSTTNDSPPSASESTDILSTLSLHLDQSFENCQRIEKAMRHLARLARAMPANTSGEPF